MSQQTFAIQDSSARWSALGLASRNLLLGLRRAARAAMIGRRAPGPSGVDLHLASGDGPPDLDELWRDLNKKLGGLFGGKGGAPRGNGAGGDKPGGPNFQPDMKSAGIGAVLIAGVVALIWLGSGFFIVQEGEQAVVTSFGKFSRTEDAGFKWRLPYPFQAHETVRVTQLRSREVGKNVVNQATGRSFHKSLSGRTVRG